MSIGPPKITTENSMGGVLAARKGLDYYCNNCNEHIAYYNWEVS